ncbi:hypothetical protein ACFQVC_28180 [Streptomyces monticola]|uniref:Uncharacterized protein n=1 Tax=Streptomyces monticola TaxID=2666263 RepID=A0ABW2JRQ8_9ACTN
MDIRQLEYFLAIVDSGKLDEVMGVAGVLGLAEATEIYRALDGNLN